ncbi:MAG TPA: hypothetical protein VI306_16235, partial [Pyrinomonadaceae bacterium]
KSVEVPAADRFTGSVTGAATPRTLELIELWKNRNYRCPVVVECWGSKQIQLTDKTQWWGRWLINGKPIEKPYGENIWLWDDPKQFNAAAKGRRMFVKDFTRRYDHDSLFTRLVDPSWGRWLIGRQNYKSNPFQDGPANDLASRQVAVEITPLNLTGKPYDSLTNEAKITYRVVRAVSEAECQGYFDTINCWDKALMSLGPCHWTIAHPEKQDGGADVLQLGELEAFFAYVKSQQPLVFNQVFVDSGLEPNNQWSDASILNRGLRKFESQYSQLSLVNQGGVDVEKRMPIPLDRNRFDFLRSWHWLYRIEMACRTLSDLQRLMWDMARFRLRDIGAAPVGLGIKNGAGADAKIEDVFTSEQSFIWLMQWHIFKPGQVFTGGSAGSALTEIIRTSGVSLAKRTDQWTDDDEQRLLKSFAARAPSEVKDRFNRAFNCAQLTKLLYPGASGNRGTPPSASRNSFKLDTSTTTSTLGSSPF